MKRTPSIFVWALFCIGLATPVTQSKRTTQAAIKIGTAPTHLFAEAMQTQK